MGREETISGDTARSRLYDVMGTEGSVETRLERALEVGKVYFDVEYGFITDIDESAGEWEIIISAQSREQRFGTGTEIDLANTYCRRVIETESTLSVSDTSQGWEDDPAYESGIRCFQGAPVMIDEGLFGTVCFASEDPRAAPFTEQEKTFTHLLAQMAGHEIERQRQRDRLTRQEAQLEQRREIYRALIDASFDLVYRLDTDGRFVYTSPGVEDTLGYSPGELEGELFTAVLPDESLDTAATEMGWQMYEQVMNGHTAEQQYLPLQRRDGEIIYGDLRAEPIYGTDADDSQTITAIQGIAHDATERRRRERLIRVLNRVLRHNLRNEATVINGYAGILTQRLSGENADYAHRIAETIDQLIDLSEAARQLEQTLNSQPTLESLDLVPIATRAIERARSAHPDAEIRTDLPETAQAYTAPRIETALKELLDNAGQHAGQSPAITLGIKSSAKHARLVLTDDGPGLPEQEQAVLTGGEETPLEHGSGLGLWLVYWIVTELNGSVTVPETDTGTKIQIQLPRTESVS